MHCLDQLHNMSGLGRRRILLSWYAVWMAGTPTRENVRGQDAHIDAALCGIPCPRTSSAPAARVLHTTAAPPLTPSPLAACAAPFAAHCHACGRKPRLRTAAAPWSSMRVRAHPRGGAARVPSGPLTGESLAPMPAIKDLQRTFAAAAVHRTLRATTLASAAHPRVRLQLLHTR